jgi:hypothetical protein
LFTDIHGAIRSVNQVVKNLNKNAKCLRTRLFAYSHPKKIEKLKKASKWPSWKSKSQFESEDFKVNSIDDCIDGIQAPLFGFRVNVTLLTNSPCILGITCRNSLPLVPGKKC